MAEFDSKTILITGGTGSFGHTVARHLLDTNCAEIRIFSRDELKQEQMRIEFANQRVRFIIGDVRDSDSVDRAMTDVDLVFHAAALKQVPSCEFFPMQAVMTNVLGSNNVIRAAVKHGVKNVVCLSTDKAVYPVNAMGMSKAMMEKVALAAAREHSLQKTTVCCVRYGNVMSSRGSVIPLFIQQMRENKPLTITEPEMTRFMLPLRSAVDLVLFALSNGRPGDLFVRKAPSCTIGTLAQAIRQVFKSSVPEKIIGIRHGEKIYETLLTAEEMRRSEDMGEYYRVPTDDRDLNYTIYFSEGDTGKRQVEDYTSHNTRRLTLDDTKKLLTDTEEIQHELRGWPQA